LQSGARIGPRLEKTWLERTVAGYFETGGTILAFAVAALGFVAVSLLVNRLLRPSRPWGSKLTTYECGMDPVGAGWSQTHVRYYLYAFLFVVFDVESIFIFPWAVVYERLGTYGFVSMTIFILVLALGILYAWRKGVLRWV
jgi:NADH-quinone oxidoreductase subunit A